MKEILISDDEIKELHPIFRGKHGPKIIKFARKAAGLDIACRIYDESKHLSGIEFTTDLLNKLGLRRTVINEGIIDHFKDRPFIVVANHPNGHIDGISLIETIGSRVDNFKVMVNYILGMIDTMDENFIKVNPYTDSKNKHISLSGIKESITHMQLGNSIGFFPAGSVSRLKFKKGKFVIYDRDWQESVIKLIQRANLPVIPVYIDSRNSYKFYTTRFIHWSLQTLALCHEFENKNGKEIRLIFGKPIEPEKITEFKDTKQLADFLRQKTYNLAKDI